MFEWLIAFLTAMIALLEGTSPYLVQIYEAILNIVRILCGVVTL